MHNPTLKCRPVKGISKRVDIEMIKDTDKTEQPNNKEPKHSTHDVYLRLQRGKGFHNLIHMSYVKYINSACKAWVINTTIQSIYAITIS
jgi:hypothetical protein